MATGGGICTGHRGLIVNTEFEQLTLHHRARYNMAKGMTQRLERRRTVEMMGPGLDLPLWHHFKERASTVQALTAGYWLLLVNSTASDDADKKGPQPCG